MNQARNIHYPGLIENNRHPGRNLINRHPGRNLINRHPGLDPGSILISNPPTQKWIPDRASLVRNDVGQIVRNDMGLL